MKVQANITILIIGSEIVSGKTLDTNSQYIVRSLGRSGFAVSRIVAIKDEESEILRTLDQEFQRSNIIVSTGGLGPTFDDVTISAIARFFGVPLVFHDKAFRSISAYFKHNKKVLNPDRKRQAFLPRGCEIIANTKGVVPGIIMCEEGKHLIAVPGVPYEMEAMCATSLPGYLRRKFITHVKRDISINTAGISESSLEKKIRGIVRGGSRKIPVEYGIYPRCGDVQVKVAVTGTDKSAVVKAISHERAKFTRAIKPHIYGYDNETLQGVLVQSLREQGLTLALAESCTGGLIAKTITDVPGASRVFKGGCVLYSNQSKEQILDVPVGVLKAHGAVSAAVARRMAMNARVKFGADHAIAVTGIAGPGGGTIERPVGLVYIAWASACSVRVAKFMFFGARDAVRVKTMKQALFHLFKSIT